MGRWGLLPIAVSEEIPAVPIFVPWQTRILPERVASATIDQFTNMAALDRIALEEAGS
jgi:hypothetical protein